MGVCFPGRVVGVTSHLEPTTLACVVAGGVGWPAGCRPDFAEASQPAAASAISTTTAAMAALYVRFISRLRPAFSVTLTRGDGKRFRCRRDFYWAGRGRLVPSVVPKVRKPWPSRKKTAPATPTKKPSGQLVR